MGTDPWICHLLCVVQDSPLLFATHLRSEHTFPDLLSPFVSSQEHLVVDRYSLLHLVCLHRWGNVQNFLSSSFWIRRGRRFDSIVRFHPPKVLPALLTSCTNSSVYSCSSLFPSIVNFITPDTPRSVHRMQMSCETSTVVEQLDQRWGIAWRTII